ncbi:MAG: YHS domain-containing protein, partial [Gammaproteobacteria bacterium]|nr:YHS domain-containing protein [Gammaproteobacteria bacterium]
MVRTAHPTVYSSMNNTLTDPVCGMTVTPASEHHYAYKNIDYWFCCSGCQNKFSADPEHYLNPPEAQAAANDTTDSDYI